MTRIITGMPVRLTEGETVHRGIYFGSLIPGKSLFQCFDSRDSNGIIPVYYLQIQNSILNLRRASVYDSTSVGEVSREKVERLSYLSKDWKNKRTTPGLEVRE